jgi:hypothetical protein
MKNKAHNNTIKSIIENLGKTKGCDNGRKYKQNKAVRNSRENKAEQGYFSAHSKQVFKLKQHLRMKWVLKQNVYYINKENKQTKKPRKAGTNSRNKKY